MLDQIKWYTVYPDANVDKAITDMTLGWKRVVIWLVFDWNKFEMKIIDDYLESKIKELLWKSSEQ